MGHRGSDAQTLTSGRTWPLAVRRARPEDRDAVLGFATHTWEGWDYIPHSWPVWIDADDGVFLVGVPAPPNGEEAVDADGQPLEPGRPVAIARVAMVSENEAWLEGIRVDPRLRGLDIGTNLQTAELYWAAANGATVIRYATGARNEGSHRLGARHGFELLAAFRSWWWTTDPDSDRDDPDAYDPQRRVQATGRRQELLAGFAGAGWIAAPTDADALWRRVATDPGFLAGERLYEPRPWAMQELTQWAFARHVATGEVIVPPAVGEVTGAADWAVAILPREQPPAEDSSLRLALLVGAGRAPVTLAEKARELAGRTVRFRTAGEGGALDGSDAPLTAAGYRAAEWRLHVLARPLDAANPPPPMDPTSLVVAEKPAHVIRPPIG